MNTKYSEEQGDGSFMKHLILASGSPRRRELMSQVGLDFTVVECGYMRATNLEKTEKTPPLFQGTGL